MATRLQPGVNEVTVPVAQTLSLNQQCRPLEH
jgi:hypothetical protein